MITLSLQSGVIEYILKDAFVDMVLLETLGQMGLIAPRIAKTLNRYQSR